MTDPQDIPGSRLSTRERKHRRLQARRVRLRRRQLAALVAAAVAVLVIVIAVAGAGDETQGPRGAASAARPPVRHGPAAVVAGGPLAPARVGGLAALWAPGNVVGPQSGTDAAYQAASTRSGLPGYLMIADRGNNRILIVNPAGRIVFRYPEEGRDASKLYYDDDTFIEPGGAYVISNEEENQAVVQVNLATRVQTTLFGQPGIAGSDSTHAREPDDAYMLTDGTFTAADAANCRIIFVRNRTVVRSYGHAGVCRHDPPAYFNQVNGDTPLPGGGVLVSEIEGNWIDEIGPEGHLLWSIQAPVGYPSDPQPLPGGRVLLADYSSPGHVLIVNRQGRVLWRFGSDGGRDRLDHPSLAMALPNGDIAVNDDYRERVVVIDPRSKRIVWQYGHTDVAGTAPGYLHIPDGMDFVPEGPHGEVDYAAVVHP